MAESSTALEGSSSGSATLWVSDRSSSEAKAFWAKADRFQERCPGVNLFRSAGNRSADQHDLKGMISLLVMLLLVDLPMASAQPNGGDDGGAFWLGMVGLIVLG